MATTTEMQPAVDHTKRFPSANRAYHPRGYDLWWGQGRQAAAEGKPRKQPFSFAYSF